MRRRFAVAIPTMTTLFLLLATASAVLVAMGATGTLLGLPTLPLSLSLMAACATGALTAQFAWPVFQRSHPSRPFLLGLSSGLLVLGASVLTVLLTA